MKNKDKNKLVFARKKKIAVFSSIAVLTLAGTSIAGCVHFLNTSHSETSAMPIDEANTKQSFLYNGTPLVFDLNNNTTLQNGVLVTKSNFDTLTPMYFYANYRAIGNNPSVLQALNSLNLPFLANNLSNSLVISAYQVANANTITPQTNSVSFNAIYITNPNANSKITLSFSNGYVTLEQNQGVWLYGMNNHLCYDLNNNSNSFSHQTSQDLSPILELNNLYNTFTSTGTSPTLPPSSYLQQAQKELLNNYKSLFLADFESLLNYLNNTSSITVNAMGTTATISFKNLTTNLNDLVFNVVNGVPQVTIPYLKASMTINVPSAGLNLKLTLNQPSTTFPLVAFVAYKLKDNNNLQTVPAITSNSLNNVTFANSGVVSANATNPAFCYYLNNNTALSLYEGNTPFTMQKVSFNFLWTYVWMLNHPTKISYNNKTRTTLQSYGSVYNGGNIDITPTKASIPTSWNNVATISLKNDPVLISSSQYDDFISYYSSNISNDENKQTSKATSSFIVFANSSNSTLANLFNTIKQSNSQLTTLPSYINYSFLVTVTVSNNEATVTVKEINFYNNSKPTNSTSQVTTITINGTAYPIYNTYGTDFVSASVGINESFSLLVSKNSAIASLDLPTTNSITLPTSLSSLYLYGALFNEEVENTKSTNYSLINNAFLQEAKEWLANSQDLEISGIGFANNNEDNKTQPTISSLTITNNSKQAQTFANNGVLYTILPNSSYTYNLQTAITITGFCNVMQLNNSFNVANYNKGYYNELMAGNFSANSTQNTNQTHNTSILQFLNDLLSLSNQNSEITAYTSNSTSSNATSLTLTSLTIDNKGPAFYLDIGDFSSNSNSNVSSATTSAYVLVKSGISTVSLNISLTNLATVLASATMQTLNNYLAQCKTYLAGLSIAQLQALISQVANIDGTTQTGTMPSATSLIYSNFSIKISNYDTNNLTFDINDFNWDINGKALDIPVLGTVSINTGVSLKNVTVPVQLVPMVYYINKTTKEVCSYPSIVTTATDTFSEAGVSKKVGISTVLDYSLNGISASNISNARMGFFLNYVQAVPNQTAYYGNGLALPTIAGADHSAEPYLNFSYAINSFLMQKDSTTYGISGTSFKAFTPNVANVFVYGSQNQTYTSSQIAKLDLTNGYNILTFLNAFYSQNFTDIFNTSLALNNPYLSITSYSVVANELTGFYIKNTSHITYLFEDETSNGASAIYLMPESSTYVPITAITYSVSNITTATVDLSSQKDSNSYTHSLFKAVRYLADDYGYLYPLLWTQDNDNCLSYSFWGVGYYWNQGSSPITINLQTWKAYISTGPIGDDRTINMNMIGGSLFNTNNSTLANALSSYTAYTNGKDIYFTSLTISGVVFSGLNITLSPGNHFRLA